MSILDRSVVGTLVPFRPHRLRDVAGLVVAVSLVIGAASWSIGRPHAALRSDVATMAAREWCAYNFPHGSTDPNSATYACVLGFIDGAREPDADRGRAESTRTSSKKAAHADSPAGLWDVAYLAGWQAGQDAAASA